MDLRDVLEMREGGGDNKFYNFYKRVNSTFLQSRVRQVTFPSVVPYVVILILRYLKNQESEVNSDQIVARNLY